MDSRSEGSFLICGLGSIGKVHLEKIIEYSESVHVVDPNQDTLKYLRSNPKYAKVKWTQELRHLNTPLRNYIVVVSNWGPDHLKVIETTMTMGATRFVVEKPLVSSLEALVRLRELSSSERIRFVTNLPFSNSALSNIIISAANKFDLGEIVSIVVQGGAKCLVTNGIHYVGLAIKLFKNSPENVSAQLTNSSINPRNKNFLFLGGSATWNFPDNKQLTISFTNESHVQLSTTIYLKFGKIIIDESLGKVLAISSNDRIKLDKPSKTFYAREEVFSFNPYDANKQLDGMIEIYRKISGPDEGIWQDYEHGLISTEAMFGMLISQDKKRQISLPLSSNYTTEYMHHEWNIS